MGMGSSNFPPKEPWGFWKWVFGEFLAVILRSEFFLPVVCVLALACGVALLFAA